MSAGALNQLVSRISGDHVIGFVLVLVRIAPLFILAPLFSSRMIPPRVRGTVAVALAIGLTPVALHGHNVPTDPLAIAGLALAGLLVGLALAFAVAALLAAIEAAGAISDALGGFSFGGMLDPVNGNQGGVLTSFYGLVGLLAFVTIGGDAWTLRGLARTFAIVPVNRAPQINSLVAGAEQAFTSIFTSALEVAAPAVLALLVTDVAFGMVSRVVPQLNVFAVGFPVKVGVALLIVSATLPLLGGWMSNQIESSVATALHSLQIA